jgi:4-carboxymuconolactone decarboxylase
MEKTDKLVTHKEFQDFLKSLNPRFADFSIRVADEVWDLPLIDQKTKALIAIAADVVNMDYTGQGNPFTGHVDLALKQGATREEIEEILLFMCVYGGFNKVAGAFGTLNHVFGQRIALNQGEKKELAEPKEVASRVGQKKPAIDNRQYKNAVLDDKELQENLKRINPKFGDLVTRVAGEVWGLPLIDQKTKAIITIAVDIINTDYTGHGNPFPAHVDMALKQGSTREEIEEVLLFMCIYAGFNKVAGAFGTLNEILGSSNAETKGEFSNGQS